MVILQLKMPCRKEITCNLKKKRNLKNQSFRSSWDWVEKILKVESYCMEYISYSFPLTILKKLVYRKGYRCQAILLSLYGQTSHTQDYHLDFLDGWAIMFIQLHETSVSPSKDNQSFAWHHHCICIALQFFT